MANMTEPGVQGYLDELDRALRHLPRQRRQEIIRDVQAHIESALADAPDRSRAVVGAILDDLGTPTEIAAAADVELPATQQRIASVRVLPHVSVLVRPHVSVFDGEHHDMGDPGWGSGARSLSR